MATSISNPSASVIYNEWTNVYSGSPVSGFSGTVRVVVEVTNNAGVIKLANSSGVTAVTKGYGSLTGGNATSIAFEGSESAVNAALRQLQVYSDQPNNNVGLRVSAVLAGNAYNPETGHYYEYVANSGLSWDAARAAAEGRYFNGMRGYLASITSQDENNFIVNKLTGNAWIGGSDALGEGTWKWYGGPDDNLPFFNDNGTANDGATGTSPRFHTWQSNEPNNSSGNENYAQLITTNTGNLVAGKWND